MKLGRTMDVRGVSQYHLHSTLFANVKIGGLAAHHEPWEA